MTHFAMPLSSLMTKPVITVDERASLDEAYALLKGHEISCLAVTGADGKPAGVISRTDFLRIGRIDARFRSRRSPLLVLPERAVADVMKREIVTLGAEEPVSAASKVLVSKRIHRVFVMDGERLAGVFSTKEVLLAVQQKKVAAPISTFMSSPAFTVPVSSSLSLASDRLEKARVSGLCVVDEDEWPVGTFTQSEALAARELAADTPVEEVMSYAMLCLDVRTPLYRAAAQAYATRARRVLAVEARQVKGVLTGIDFARATSMV